MFLKSSLVFSILSFSCISLHYLFKKAFLSLLAILWSSVFSRVYFSLSPLPFSSPQLILELRQTTSFPSCISFSLGWLWSLPPVHCYELLSIVLQILCLSDLISWIFSSPPLYHKGFDLGHTWMNGLVVLPTFLQFKPEFCNNEHSQLRVFLFVCLFVCFYWLYRASPSLAANNIISLILVLTIWWCLCVASSLVYVGRGYLLWAVPSFGKTLLVFALLHCVLNAKLACYSGYLLTSYFQSNPLCWKGMSFLVLESVVGLHRTSQLQLFLR